MSQPISVTPSLTKRKLALYASAAIALIMVFALYFIPEVVIGLAEQAWALCGW